MSGCRPTKSPMGPCHELATKLKNVQSCVALITIECQLILRPMLNGWLPSIAQTSTLYCTVERFSLLAQKLTFSWRRDGARRCWLAMAGPKPAPMRRDAPGLCVVRVSTKAETVIDLGEVRGEGRGWKRTCLDALEEMDMVGDAWRTHSKRREGEA